MVDPLIVSWGYKSMSPSHSTFLDYHQTNGTRDFSAFLTIPDAIQFMEENHWDDVSRECRELVIHNAPILSKILGAVPLAPMNEDFIRQLCSASIKTAEPEKLQRHLFEEYHIEIPVMRHGNQTYLRYSINAFNDQHDLDRLFDAIGDIKKRTGLIE
jgi:isopenicillin-N epimerase